MNNGVGDRVLRYEHREMDVQGIMESARLRWFTCVLFTFITFASYTLTLTLQEGLYYLY